MPNFNFDINTPRNQLRSKVNRAVAAFLISMNCGTTNDVAAANSIKVNKYPNTNVSCPPSTPNPPLTGMRRYRVMVSVKGSAAQDNPDEPNPETKRVEFDRRSGITCDALMQSDDGQSLAWTARAITAAGRALAVDASNGTDPAQVQFAANNADMVDFTVVGWFDAGDGDGMANADDCDWEDIYLFDCDASPSNCD